MKLISLLACIAMLLTLFGCSEKPASAESAPTNSSVSTTAPTAALPSGTLDDPTSVYDAPMAMISLPILVQDLKSEADDKIIATYTRQDVSVTLPDADVAQSVELDLLNRIDRTQNTADQIFNAAQKDYIGQTNWLPYSCSVIYAPVRMDKNVLSLFGVESSFDGSPRSNATPVSLNYDLTTGACLSLRTILHEENFADTLCDMILDGLDAQSASLFDDYKTIIRDRFSTNVPVDTWYFSENGLCFYFAPYEIAPFSMGTIVSEIPYGKISGLLKDAYFPAEKTAYNGVVMTHVGADAQMMTQFSQFAEVRLGDAADKLLIYTQGSISNVRLHYTDIDGNSVVVLGMAGMGPKDAILAELSLEWAIGNLKITFDSYGQSQTLTLTKSDDGNPAFVK